VSISTWSLECQAVPEEGVRKLNLGTTTARKRHLIGPRTTKIFPMTRRAAKSSRLCADGNRGVSYDSRSIHVIQSTAPTSGSRPDEFNTVSGTPFVITPYRYQPSLLNAREGCRAEARSATADSKSIRLGRPFEAGPHPDRGGTSLALRAPQTSIAAEAARFGISVL
jgi:hypothetical protein